MYDKSYPTYEGLCLVVEVGALHQPSAFAALLAFASVFDLDALEKFNLREDNG